MADLIRKMQEGHTVEDLDTVIDEVYEARGEYDSLGERLDDMSSGTPAPASSTPSMDGTGSAGTSNQYARADHVHPSDTSKQNALSSTQLDAVNSGINSPKVAQIEINKNNILLLESLNGGKNIARVASATKTGSGYFLSNAANTLTIPQNTAVYICFDYDVSSGQVSFQLTNSNGDVLSGTSVYTPTGPATGHKVQKVIPTTNDAKGYNAYNNGSGTVQISNIMIVPADIYESGFTDYQPYAMSNAELTNNIPLINNFKYQDITIKLSDLTWAQGVSGEYYSSSVSVPNATEIVSIMWITDSYIRDTDRITPHVVSSDRSKIGLYANTDTFAHQNATVSFLILYK